MNLLASFQRPFLLAAAMLLASAAYCPAAEHGDAETHAPAGIKEDLPLWGLVAFVGFLFAIKKLGWDSLTSGMREREAKEAELIGAAERLRDEAAASFRRQRGQMEALDEEIRGVLAEAERDADHTRREIRSVAENEAQLARQRAELEISRSHGQSLNELFAAAADRIAEQAAARIREKLSSSDQQKLMDDAVGEFLAHSAS